MNASGTFAAWLQDRIRTLPLETVELARLLGVNRSTVSRWLSGRSRPSAENLPLLAEAVGETMTVLYRLAGYPVNLGEFGDLTLDEMELIANYRKLAPEQKRVVQAAARA